MPEIPPSPSEAARLALLQSYAILDTPYERTFDGLAARAAGLFEAPMAAMTLVDRDRIWLKATFGLGVREVPRSAKFCTHTVLTDDVLAVDDALSHPLFADSVMVTGEPFVRFYAGAPLISPHNGRLGSICVLDRAARSATAAQRRGLAGLAREAMALLEVRRALDDATGLLLSRPPPMGKAVLTQAASGQATSLRAVPAVG